jgi:hypothetical protein
MPTHATSVVSPVQLPALLGGGSRQWRGGRAGSAGRRLLSFYDTRFAKLAQQSVYKVNFNSLIDFATKSTFDEAALIKSARYLQVKHPHPTHTPAHPASPNGAAPLSSLGVGRKAPAKQET